MIARTLFAFLALAGGLLLAQDHGDKKPAAEQKAEPKVEHRAALYPTDTCIVSDEKLGEDAVTFEVGGTTFKACCTKCQKKVEKDPATFQKKLEEEQKKAQLAHYPLEVCVVSGEKLGSMGAPVQLVLDGTLVQLCCKSCVKKATAKPAEMAAKVKTAAYEQQKKSINETCPVSGEKIGEEKVDVMFGTRLVRFCCEKCAAKFEKEPAKYEANLKQHAATEEHGKDAEKKDAGKSKEHGDKKDHD